MVELKSHNLSKKNIHVSLVLINVVQSKNDSFIVPSTSTKRVVAINKAMKCLCDDSE